MRTAEALRKEAERLLKRAALIMEFGDDYDNGAVIRFKREYIVGGPNTYSYVAIRANGKWYITGKYAGMPMDWETLVSEWLVNAFDVRIATKWKLITP